MNGIWKGKYFAALLVLVFVLLPHSVSAAFNRPLFLGSTGPDVVELQTILRDKGFFIYPEITGYYGQVTLQAVADFQRSIGLDHLGYVGPATRVALNAFLSGTLSLPDRPLSLGMSGTDVSALQSRLKELGFFTYPTITGYYGPVTEAAVRAYQIANGLPQSGIVDAPTHTSLEANSSVEEPAPPPSEPEPETRRRRSGSRGGGGDRDDDPPADTTSPQRSNGSPSGTLPLNTASTTISLDTDEEATCRYATSPGQAFSSMTPFDTTGGTTHTELVSGLTNGGSYGYYVKCSDEASNVNDSDYAISFTVAADATSPTVSLTAPANNAVVSGTAVSLTATASDDIGVAGVQFKRDGSIPIGAEDTSPSYAVTWDTTAVSDGSHTLLAVARDTNGNYATSSIITVTVDNSGPSISAISSGTPGETQATITWTTDDPSDSRVDYGTTTSYGTASTSATLTTSHSITLTGLTASTTYHFRVQSTDAFGNVTVSGDQTFTTAAPAVASTVTLTEVANGRVFQRSAGATAGPVELAGTYTGSFPAVEARVLLAADDTEVVTWTTVDSSLSSSTWSGSITVPQGGAYYVEVRVSDEPSVTDTGTTQFYVGMIIVGYGQSNWLGHMSVSASPPAAAAGTAYFNGTSWGTPPSANGVRELLNGVVAKTGIPAGIVSGGYSGVPLSWLIPGGPSGEYEALSTRIAASGGDAEYIVFLQGEGDADQGTSQVSWISQLDTLHGAFAASVGRSKAEMPLVLSSIATRDGGPNDNWTAFRKTQIEAANQLANVYYSHSNVDAVRVDSYHYNGASYGRSGARYAHSIAVLEGDETDFPNWFATTTTRVDTTHTDVVVEHVLGTDFTPTSGITGFYVSNDGGASWATSTAAVRQNATTIRLTHPDMGTVSRQVRYQSGTNPDISGAVHDNSALAVPLNFTPDPLTAAGAVATPIWTYVANANSTSNVQSQTTGSISLNGTSSGWLLAVGITSQTGVGISSVTVTPNVGSAVTATLVVAGAAGGSPTASLYQAAIPDGATSVTVTTTYTASPFATARVGVWRATAADFTSTTATDAKTVRTAATSSTGFTLNVKEGGAIIVLGVQAYSDTSQPLNATASSLSFAERYDSTGSGAQHAGYDTSQIAADNAASAVTITSTDTATMRVTAAHWR